DASVSIHQDARVYAGLFSGAEQASYALPRGRLGYVHVARGGVSINGQKLAAGDALKTDAGEIRIEGGDQAEVLLFDLPYRAD
ncbi:MAG TPA: quercetin 2,3-dioxygenase, partial [Burkholderiales bacterium]|nr:quercetin 2,3-dioxygenase [Burkholderiales bacterium]